MAKVTMLFLLLLVSQADAAPLTINQVQDALRGGKNWRAGESWVTDLSGEERKQLLGAELPPGFGDTFYDREEKLPARGERRTLDWRDYGGQNYVSPVLNQGRCGSCVAFAVIGALETQMNISRLTPNSPWAYSAQHLFSCGGAKCDAGWRPGSAMSFLKSKGVPDEACFPYMSGAKGEDMACKSSCADGDKRSFKIADYTTPTWLFGSKDAIKNALQTGPVVSSMIVYDDFFFYKSGVYTHTTGAMAGGHAVMIVGYSDEEQAWIIRNSWGEEWGMKGFAKISWNDTSGVGTQTWGVKVGEAEGFITLGSLRDREVLSGDFKITTESNLPNPPAIDVIIEKVGENGRTYFPTPMGDGKFMLNTKDYEDGVYRVVASAEVNGKTLRSQPRTIFVLNHAPKTAELKFTNLKAGQEIRNLFVLEFDAISAPIPFKNVVFKARNIKTGEIIVKSTPNVAPKMALSWRTQGVAAGEYEVSLSGDFQVFSVETKGLNIKVVR